MKLRITTMIITWLVAVPAAISGAVMMLWNLLLPDMLGLAPICYWQALGLFVLCQLLTGGCFIGLFAMAGVWHRMFHNRILGHRAEAQAKWEAMTNDERREFIMRRWNNHRHGWMDDERRGNAGTDHPGNDRQQSGTKEQQNDGR